MLCLQNLDTVPSACFSARMEPIAVCGQLNPSQIGWSGAWLDAKARYQPQTGKVCLAIYNRSAIMSDSVAYTLTAYNLALSAKLKLVAGDSLVRLITPLRGQAVQLALEQPTNCPLGTRGELYLAD